MSLSRFQLWYGRDAAPVTRHEVRAGPLSAYVDGGDLRRVRLGGVELVQRMYVAVRDSVWNTIPATYSDVALDVANHHFTVTFQARHAYQDIRFSWRGTMTGTADGTLVYAMDGVAESDFRYAKIGFNVHHPLRECMGRPYRAHTPDGEISGVLPVHIEPQRVENGRLTALFPPYDALTLVLEGGLEVRFDFEGDLFEMQDHRNWTDGNYKTYGTPLAIPYPMDAHMGQRFHQAVRVSVTGAPPRPARRSETPRVALGDPLGRTLPPLGVGMASHGAPLSAHEAGLLRRLQLDHLRVDVHLQDPSHPDALQRAVVAAQALGARLELALFVSDGADDQLAQFASLLQAARPPLARIMVFPEAEGTSPVAGSTPARLMHLARARLQSVVPGLPLAGGTNQFFAELNRDRPDVAAMDEVVYSLNPQVHASDDTSLVENLEAQAETVRMARSLCADRPIVISPVTLIGRLGPYAAGPPQPGELPPNVDVRQASLFGAGWTAGSIKYLSESGAASLTYYETTGWLGLMETEAGSPMPDRFPSIPGAVFPLYHVFADLAELKAGELVEARSGDPLTVEGLALRSGGRTHLLVANLTHTPQTVVVTPLWSGRVRMRRLDEESALVAMTDPTRFRSSGSTEEVRNRELELTLAPYAIVRIDELEPLP